MSSKERWRKINVDGLVSTYQVSNMGNVKLINPKTRTQIRRVSPVFSHGSCCVSLELSGGAYKLFEVADLVARTWIDSYSEGSCVVHWDGNEANNCVENLKLQDSRTWKDVTMKNVLPMYEVSSFGEVRVKSNEIGKVYKNKVSWNVKTSKGMRTCVVLELSCPDRSYRTTPIEDIVAHEFFPVKEGSKTVVYHRDGNVDNNRVDNLIVKQVGRGNESRQCIDLISGETFSSMRDAASRCGLSRSAVSDMVHGKKDEVDGYKIRYV